MKWILLPTLVALMAPRALAQEGASVTAVLRDARQALDALQYGRADTLARSLLRPGIRIDRAEHLQALLLIAAAAFPDESADRQRPDTARQYLRRAIQMSPDIEIPSAITWPGFSALAESVRRSTFAFAARPRRENELVGSTSAIPIAVVSTAPATVRLMASRVGQESSMVLIDSSGPARDATVDLRLFDADRQLLTSGQWTLSLLAVNSSGTDSIWRRFPADVVAPTLELAPIPTSIEPALLLPEWDAPKRARSVLAGVGAAGVTYLLASSVRADAPVNSLGADQRALFVGGAFTVGGLIAAFTDKGKPNPRNAAENRQRRAGWEQRMLALRQQNEQRRANYRATVTIGEVLP